MRILLAIPGHLKTVPMGRFSADALKRLGHDVIVFDYRRQPLDKISEGVTRFWSRGTVQAPIMNWRLRRMIINTRPDVFITLYGFFLDPDTLGLLRTLKIPSACWWINDPFQFQRSMEKAALYDAVFTNDSQCVEQYLAGGVRAAWFLPTACDPEVHKPTDPRADYVTDVCFAGDWSPLREKLMLSLVDKVDFKIFGPWAKKLPPDSPLHHFLQDGFFSPQDMAAMFSSAAITLNIHTWYGKADHGLNPRLFEAAACGAAQFVDWKIEIPRLFDIGRELFVYKSIQDVPAMIVDALKDRKNLAEVGAAARRRALAEHTYEHRMQKMLSLYAER